MKVWKDYLGLLLTGVAVFSPLPAFAQTDAARQLALTPPMGWNSWNCLSDHVDAAAVKATADAMVHSGMKDAGYQYVVIDDDWEKGKQAEYFLGNKESIPGRDSNGVLIPNPQTFPKGIKDVADYVHSLGLKFGLYTAPGRCTCGGHTASYGYEKLDAETFARWGVDFIKLDFCGLEQGQTIENVLSTWRTCLNQIDRPIVLSVNTGQSKLNFAAKYANMWRTTSDLRADWDFAPEDHRIFPSIKDAINLQIGLQDLHGPGHWCDPDMLQLGNSRLTDDENRAHFSMWAMLAAPLMAGNDLRTMSENTRQVLINAEVIAIDQDPAGHMGQKVKDIEPGLQIWTKRLQRYGDQAVALLNHTDKPREMTAHWPDLGIRGPAFVRDLWEHKDLGEGKSQITAVVPSHGAAMFKVMANEYLLPYPATPLLPDAGVICEAEGEGTFFGGGRVERKRQGYSGSGYVMGERHEWRCFEVVWTFQCPADGTYQLSLRYNHVAQAPLRYAINISDGQTFPLSLEPAKNETDWRTAAVNVTLPKGGYQIVLHSEDHEKYNELAVDYLKITPVKP